MEYIVGFGFLLIFLLFLRRYHKLAQFNKIADKEKVLMRSIVLDNKIMQEIYESSTSMKSKFKLKIIGKRLIAYGKIDGNLLMFKYKNDKLRIGVPWAFNTKKRYEDTEADFSDFDDEETHFDSIGSENFYFYYGYSQKNWGDVDLMIKEITEGIKEMEERRKNQLISRFESISVYEKAVIGQNEIYN